jgi:membrane-bound serine protease (ClpP class)
MSTIVSLGAAGLLLLFLEMFLPGMIAGVVGVGLLLAAVVMAYTELGSDAGNLALLLASAASAGLWWWWATYFQKTRLGQAMTLKSTDVGTSTMVGLDAYVGLAAEAVTPLRPSGTVMVAGRRLDAMTDGEFIDAGSSVSVVRTHGMGLLVRRAPQPQTE